ncbi:hypothetical protein GI582_24455 [Sulfitobacter sp. BDSS02]|nr:hypothetical protein [Sulfitobacter sp. BDSS02]MBR9852423.1 hypothetical protein [Paracoccaceae bacterium]
MDMEPLLILQRDKLSRDLARAFAWSAYNYPRVDVPRKGWAAWVEPDSIVFVAGWQRELGRPELDEFAHCTDTALRQLGYVTEAPLSIWKSMGHVILAADISAHERLQAIAFFKRMNEGR